MTSNLHSNCNENFVFQDYWWTKCGYCEEQNWVKIHLFKHTYASSVCACGDMKLLIPFPCHCSYNQSACWLSLLLGEYLSHLQPVFVAPLSIEPQNLPAHNGCHAYKEKSPVQNSLHIYFMQLLWCGAFWFTEWTIL